MSIDDRPVWLLDVDGVINVNRPGWGAAPRRGYAYSAGVEWRIRWAPALIDRIRAVHVSGLAEVRWCSTWCCVADQLERLFALPTLGRAFTDPINGTAASIAKLSTARMVVTGGQRLVWTDDVEVPTSGPLYDELTGGGRALLVRPDERRGLQPADLDAIEAFLTGGGT